MNAIELVPLPGTGWTVWSVVELRTAGFPVTAVAGLLDDTLMRAAGRDDFGDVYAAAATRASDALRAIAAGRRLREAVAWQNPKMLVNCVDKVAADSAARGPVRRRRQLKAASYLQRYALKNDTIGFFGPVGWARWTRAGAAVDCRPGPRLLARRTVYFEDWAIEELEESLCADPDLRPWLRPRVSQAACIGDGVARLPGAAELPLDAEDIALLARCDGRRTIRELSRQLAERLASTEPATGTGQRIRRLHTAGLITLGLDGRESWSAGELPQTRLRCAIQAIGDRRLRDRALAALDELESARAAVADSAGDPDALTEAMFRLDDTFERLTARQANRRGGETYAGRRLVYEDTVRDVAVTLGPPLLDALAAPLGAVLDSARWFVAAVADAYRARFLDLFERLRARHGTGEIPFPAMLAMATPDLAFSFKDLPGPVAAVVPELQRRWAKVLCVPTGVRAFQVEADDITARVKELFPSAEIPWSSAIHHCPDIMVAARDAHAVNRGDYLLVLGELHLAMNTLDCRVTTQQHPEPASLAEADARDRITGRILPVPARRGAGVNSRTYPPVLIMPHYTYWTVHAENTGAPGQVIAGARMTVLRRGDDLLVRVPGGAELDLLEVFGELLSVAVMNGFKPFAPGKHRPRVSIGRLVLARESWSFAAGALSWARVTDPARRHREALAWRLASGVPRCAFYRTPSEDKPLFADFSSVTLVNLLATAVRQAAEEDPACIVTFTELLPGLGEHWLRDINGTAYTSELRMVAQPTAGPPPAGSPKPDERQP